MQGWGGQAPLAQSRVQWIVREHAPCLTFIGKHIEVENREVCNAPCGIHGAVRIPSERWQSAGWAKKSLQRLLGQLCWLARPTAGLSPFLSQAYKSLHASSDIFRKGAAKGIAAVLLFACIPQTVPPLRGQRHTLFGDAAPTGKSTLRLGGVSERGGCRSELCPHWVCTLQ